MRRSAFGEQPTNPMRLQRLARRRRRPHGRGGVNHHGACRERKRKRHGWRDEPDQSYETQAGTYLNHVYGEKEYGGTQVLKLSGVAFEKVGMPKLPPYASAATSETIQHTLYGGLLMPIAVLGALTWVAHRNVGNVKPDDQGGEEGGQS